MVAILLMSPDCLLALTCSLQPIHHFFLHLHLKKLGLFAQLPLGQKFPVQLV